MPADEQSALAAVDRAIDTCIEAEATAAWTNGVASGTTVAAAVERFANNLPRLFELRDALRQATEEAMPE